MTRRKCHCRLGGFTDCTELRAKYRAVVKRAQGAEDRFARGVYPKGMAYDEARGHVQALQDRMDKLEKILAERGC